MILMGTKYVGNLQKDSSLSYYPIAKRSFLPGCLNDSNLKLEKLNDPLFSLSLQIGILRIHVVEAKDLKKSDTFGKSDPYVNVKVPCKTASLARGE